MNKLNTQGTRRESLFTVYTLQSRPHDADLHK